MNVELLFRIAGIGIIIAILNQLLARLEKSEYVMLTTLTGIIIVFIMLMPYVEEFLNDLKDFADF